jgi:hypothetical protein
MRKSIQLILIAIIVSVSGHIFVSNIEHIIYLNTKTYTYQLQDNSSHETIKTSIKNIEDNVAKMDKLSNSYLSEKELSDIKNTLNKDLEAAKKMSFLTYDSTKTTVNEVEFYKDINSTSHLGISGLMNSYATLAKYNDNLNYDEFVQTSLMQLLYLEFIAKDIRENYKYPNSNDYNISVDMRPLALINSVIVKLNTIEYISELVLESGDIHE